MQENQQAAATAQQDAVKANWSAIIEDHSEVVVEQPKDDVSQETAAEKDNLNTETPQDIEPVKPEETKPETEAVKEEVKEEKKEETVTAESVANTDLALTAEDIAGVPQLYEDGTFRALAKELGVELQEESFDAFKEQFVPKTQLEEVKNLTIDNIFSGLKPETVAALKLMEQGIPEEQVFAPTRQIESYLALDDAALVRADLEATEGWTPELIDHKIESLIADNKIALAAGEIRIGLNQQKNQITQTRTQLLQQYEQQKQNAILQQRQQESAQFTNALNNVSEFMGVPLTKEAKDAILIKYNNGLYENDLNAAQSKVAAILHNEYGAKLAKHIQNKASEAAKLETTKKLLNVPPVSSQTGKRVETTQNNQNDSNWGALIEGFGVNK
jgi:hypothetical protein